MRFVQALSSGVEAAAIWLAAVAAIGGICCLLAWISLNLGRPR